MKTVEEHIKELDEWLKKVIENNNHSGDWNDAFRAVRLELWLRFPTIIQGRKP